MKRRHPLCLYALIVFLPILLLYLGSVEADVYAAGPRQQQASFSVSRNILSFTGVEGGLNPRVQWFGVTNTGSEPTSASTLYTGPFVLLVSAEVKARAFCSGYNASHVTSAFFTIITGGSRITDVQQVVLNW